MKKRGFILFISIVVFLIPLFTVNAQQTEIATVVKPFQGVNCADKFQLFLLSDPLISPSQSKIVTDGDLSYMVLKFRLVNLTGEIIQGLEPDSFALDDYFRGQHYYRYGLDAVMSGIVSIDSGFTPFYEPMAINESRDVYILFDMFKGADTWLLLFRPRPYGEETALCEIRFQLPKPTVQNN